MVTLPTKYACSRQCDDRYRVQLGDGHREHFHDINAGKFKGREESERFYWITIENGGIIYAPIIDPKGMLTEEDKAKIEEVYQGIKAGTVEMPEIDEPKN